MWTGQAVLLGYLGGVAFAGRPLAGLCLGWLAAALLSGAAVLAQRLLVLTRGRSGDGAAEAGDGAVEADGAAVDVGGRV